MCCFATSQFWFITLLIYFARWHGQACNSVGFKTLHVYNYEEKSKFGQQHKHGCDLRSSKPLENTHKVSLYSRMSRLGKKLCMFRNHEPILAISSFEIICMARIQNCKHIIHNCPLCKVKMVFVQDVLFWPGCFFCIWSDCDIQRTKMVYVQDSRALIEISCCNFLEDLIM